MPVTMTSNRSSCCGSVIVLCLAAMLSGCATPLRKDLLVVAANPSGSRFPGALVKAMCVRNVSGAEKEESSRTAISDPGFRDALAASLDANGLKAMPESCKYPVDVSVLGVAQPFMAWTMTITTHMNYKVYDSSGNAILLETVSAPFTATTDDSSHGATRFRLAYEGSIRESISRFLDKLRSMSLQQLAALAATPPAAAPPPR